MATETISEAIEAWARTWLYGSGVMTRNEECYNHMQAAVVELRAQPWAKGPAAAAPAKQAST